MTTKRIDLGVLNFLANSFVNNRMCNRCPRRLLFKNDLCLLVQLCTFSLIRNDFGFLNQVIKRLMTPLSTVGVSDSIAAEKNGEKIIRVTVITSPSK